MADVVDDFEPLFDYSRVQPVAFDLVDLDDDSDTSSLHVRKRKKGSPVVKDVEEVKVIEVVSKENEEEDWLPPPPKFPATEKGHLVEDSTIKELRLKKQELKLFAKSAVDVLRAVEEDAKKEFSDSAKASLESVVKQPPKYNPNRTKVVISIQDKEELKQFRVFMDDKIDRFKYYAEKVKLDLQNLVFSFDGNETNPASTPESLGIEVHVKTTINSEKASFESVSEQPLKFDPNRAKDDKLDRLFKQYAEKAKLDPQKLVFSFDGDKINPVSTPESLGMEDDDIIEVHVKKS